MNHLYKFLFLFILVAPLEGDSAELYAIVVADTDDETLGTAFAKDVLRIEAKVKQIAKATGRHLSLIKLEGRNTRIVNVIHAIDHLKVNPDDVIVLYFFNHGSRFEGKENPWPDLYFLHDNASIDMDQFNGMVINKNPKFFLSIADSCNSIVRSDRTDPRKMTTSKTSSKPVDPHIEKLIYRRLFNETSGVIIASSSQPGQFSLGFVDYGLIFTMAFLDSLEVAIAVKHTTVQWEEIFSRSQGVVTYILKELEARSQNSEIEYVQVPQYEIILKD